MKQLSITIGDNWAEVQGYGSRDLLKELTGRVPLFNSRTRCWSTTPRRARDLATLAEIRGYSVSVSAADRGEG